MQFPSKSVLMRTAVVSVVAAVISISLSTGVRFINGVQSDMTTLVVRSTLPFMIAIPIGLFWFAKLEKLEHAYIRAIRRANELARIASVDPLTGILNRRSFIEQFDAASAAGIRGWFLLADIDYLKVINDKYGHVVGDDAVIAVAHAMVRELPTDSLIARIGGDEFCAFIPKTANADIERVIAQINATAAAIMRMKHPEHTQDLTLSVGQVRYKSKQRFKDIMSLADQRMYLNKKTR